MQLENFELKFEKLSKTRKLTYTLGVPAREVDILQAEANLGVSFPEQIKLFYGKFNGLHVENPALDVLPIVRLEFDSSNRLHFATLDHERRLYFDTSTKNEAGQWDIVSENGFKVTLTMASFWSNKIFAWIENERPIWEEFSCQC